MVASGAAAREDYLMVSRCDIMGLIVDLLSLDIALEDCSDCIQWDLPTALVDSFACNLLLAPWAAVVIVI
jgi:hypothetical protein